LYSKQIIVFLFFVLAASVGWLMNKLSYDYLRTVSYRVDFYNSGDMRRIFKVETDISAQVNMNGFLAMRYKFAKPDIIRIDVKDKILTKVRNFVLSTEIFQKISEQLGDGKRLVSISPDTIFFTYADLQSKRVPIVSNLQLAFKSEYMQKGKTILTPDSIWISAEQSVLESINEIPCAVQQYTDISESINGSLELDLSKLKNISAQQQKISFRVNVERYIETAMTLPLQLTNKPDSLDVMLFPRDIEVKYRANIADFAKIKASDFKITVDFKDFEKSINGNLKVNVYAQPQSVLQIDLYPDFVEAIVTKK
jgi:YbbR domain-containing protein